MKKHGKTEVPLTTSKMSFALSTQLANAVSLLDAEVTRSTTLELSAAFGNYFQAIEDRPETERDEARLAVVNVRRELLQAMRGELGVDEVVT
jgi:hypothetical protein